jgi:hypothetical protein
MGSNKKCLFVWFKGFCERFVFGLWGKVGPSLRLASCFLLLASCFLLLASASISAILSSDCVWSIVVHFTPFAIVGSPFQIFSSTHNKKHTWNN